MKKSILALLLAVLMVASLLPPPHWRMDRRRMMSRAYTNGRHYDVSHNCRRRYQRIQQGRRRHLIELLKMLELKASDVSSILI